MAQSYITSGSFLIMKSANTQLIVIIAGTILLPLILFTVYEITSIKESEKVIEKVYRDQLDAILFSVNQYSDDIINGVLDKLENQLNEKLTVDSIAPSLMLSNLKVILLKDPETGETSAISLDTAFTSKWTPSQDSLLQNHGHLTAQLLRYKEGGYRKVEPVEQSLIDRSFYQVIHSVIETPSGRVVLFTGLLSINGFAENVLAPKLQQIAEDELIITMGRKGTDGFIYLTDSLTKEVMFKKPMWLFPEMEVGISSKNKTVSELVDERTFFNLLAASLLILLLILGFALIVRNLRREVQLAQNKADFVSNVSHELRTPLSLISMFAETLMLDRVPNVQKRKEYEEIIYKETNRLTNIVNKILNFSQIEANKRIYHPTMIDLNELITEMMHDYSYHLEKNGFTYQVELSDLPGIYVDKDAIYEALVNLVDNAMKYSPEIRHILIRSGMLGQKIFVAIEDRGMGIPGEKINLIFEKFYRITERNVQTTRGAGLGLSLVKHIMDHHGGDIEVESTKGKGSIFKLVFYLDKNGTDISR